MSKHLSSYLSTLAALLLGLLVPAVLASNATGDPRLAEAQRHLESGDPGRALTVLDGLLARGRKNAQALLLRSTAKIMNGDSVGGFADLERALAIDPTLRQGWLNLAGMEIAEGRYDAAYEALVKAEKLDPNAVDNPLNLGTVQLLRGRLDAAAEQFQRYLERRGDDPGALYEVASNYALAGRQEQVVEHLGQAIAGDERLRLRARQDDRFAALDSLDYKVLLNTDSYRPPAGARTAAAGFRTAYDATDPRLLYAVVDALEALGEPFDRAVEVAARWALVWGDDLRIKVTNQSDGTGVISVSGPREIGEAEWRQRTDALFRTVYELLGDA